MKHWRAMSTSGAGLARFPEAIGIERDYLAGLLQFFQLLLIKERKEQLFFADPLAVLRHLQATGVNGLTKQVWSKGRLSDFAKEYTKRFSTAEGVVLTYHPLYFVATSPEVLHASLSSSANFKQCSTT